MKLKENKGLVVVMLLVLSIFSVVLLSGCGADVSDEPQTVKIGLLSIDDSFPFYVAEKEGLYEKYGVQVELVSFSSARDKDTALEAGELDGVMTDFVVTGLLNKGGLDVKAVSTALGANAKEGRFALLVAPNSGITSIEQLKGKPIGIGNNTIIQFVTQQILMMNGFTKDEINTQNIPDLKLRLDTLVAGNGIVAAVLPDPLASLGELEGAKILLDDTDLGVNLSQSIVVFRQESIDNKSDEISKVLAAYNEAKTMINENGDKYREELLEFAKVPGPLQNNYPMPKYTPNVVPTKEEVARVMDWMAQAGLLESAYSYENVVDTGFIK